MGLSNRIRELRFKNAEMTPKELAEQVGVSRQMINAIEDKKHSRTIEVAIRIADAFREAVDDVFEYDYDGKPDFLIDEVDLDDPPDRLAASLPERSAVVTRHGNRTAMRSWQAKPQVPGE